MSNSLRIAQKHVLRSGSSKWPVWHTWRISPSSHASITVSPRRASKRSFTHLHVSSTASSQWPRPLQTRERKPTSHSTECSWPTSLCGHTPEAGHEQCELSTSSQKPSSEQKRVAVPKSQPAEASSPAFEVAKRPSPSQRQELRSTGSK